MGGEPLAAGKRGQAFLANSLRNRDVHAARKTEPSVTGLSAACLNVLPLLDGVLPNTRRQADGCGEIRPFLIEINDVGPGHQRHRAEPMTAVPTGSVHRLSDG